jgi:membrane protein DedA with SNARE-associated domain
MNPEQLIATYGYAALFVGTVLEGESFLIAAAVLAASGHMEWSHVLLTSVAGAVTGDQIFFHSGRLKGRYVLEKKPAWEKSVQTIFTSTRQYHSLVMLTLRFIYGFRMILPFALGLGGIRPGRFLALDLIGAVIWTGAISAVGVCFWQLIAWAEGPLAGEWKWVLAGCCALGVTMAGLGRIAYRRALGMASRGNAHTPSH